jgi:hypothetical protein
MMLSWIFLCATSALFPYENLQAQAGVAPGNGQHDSYRNAAKKDQPAVFKFRQQAAFELDEYMRARNAVCPAPTAKVFLRGNFMHCYHWQKSCPVFTTKSCFSKTSQAVRTMTRTEAEARNYFPCNYCCELSQAGR